MTFEAPDEQRFPALTVAREAGLAGPGSSAVLIAADDVAVERFLEGSLSLGGMTDLVAAAVTRFGSAGTPGLDELEGIDAEVRAWASDATVEQRTST